MATSETGNPGRSIDPAPDPKPVGVPPPLPPPLPSAPKRISFRSLPVLLLVAAAAAVGVVGTAKIFSPPQRADTTRKPSRTSRAPVRTETVSGSGVTHSNDRIAQGPWSIHIAKVDRSRKDLTYFAPLATGKVLGVNRISQQASSVPPELGRAIAGVNGDFYERDSRTYAGDPRGLQILNGELVSDTSTVCVWFDGENNPHVDEVKGDFKITWPDGTQTAFGLNKQRQPNFAVLYTPTYGPSTRATGGRDLILEKEGDGPWLPLPPGETLRAKIRAVEGSADTPLPPDCMILSLGPILLPKLPVVTAGASLVISTATVPSLKGIKTAIGGGPALVKDGKSQVPRSPSRGTSHYSERSKYERHPRSAIGWDSDYFYLLTVDGRQPDLSVGMTLAELGEYMAKLGCQEGMNLDGGVSAAMWMDGRIVSDPCQGERSVANSIFVIRKPVEP